MNEKKMAKNNMKIGEVYMMNFGGSGSEQSGWRPGVVFQNNVGNAFSPNVIALPLTSSLKKMSQPTHVVVRAADSGLMKDSMVLCENPERMSKDRVGQFVTKLPRKYMKQIAEANLIATGAVSFLDAESLVQIWKTVSKMNSFATA